MADNPISNRNTILKKFGFAITEEKKAQNVPEFQIVELKNGKRYTFKTIPLMKTSALIEGMYHSEDNQTENKLDDEKNMFVLPGIIDEKFMEFLLDYVEYVDQNGLPVFSQDKVIAATVLEAAIGPKLYELFIKHFGYKFQRSDLAVKQYLNIFGHMLTCSTIIISNSLITLFAIAHAIIIKHLPSSEFIIMDE